MKKAVLGISIIILTSISAGCVKKRPDMISPSHTDPSQFRLIPKDGDIDKHLNAVSDPAIEEIKSSEDLGHVIVTGEESTLGDLVEASSVRIDKSTGFAFPHYVNFKTNSPLIAENIDQIKLFGHPNSTYRIRYELTPKYLKIYKEVPDAQITHYEIPYSIKKADKWWVPVGGYAVSYYKRKKQVNADNRETNIIDFFNIAPENYKTATHYKYDSESFIPFKRYSKTNIFPYEYFKGEWYFATTIVSTRQGQESAVGFFDSSMDASLRGQATRIKFLRSKDFLRAVNTIVDQRAEVTEDQLSDALNIPAKWYDFRTEMEGEYEGLAEEFYPANDFEKRQYVALDLKFVKSLALDKASTSDYFSGIELSDIKFSEKEFSFTIHTVSSGIKRKFSFARIPKNEDYKPRTAFFEDSKYFGVFNTQIFKLLDINEYGEGDTEKRLLLNRFNPNKPIVFRFSTQTPKLAEGEKDVYGLKIDYRRIGKNTAAYWSRVFELVGAKARVVVDESKDNELGEFETNTINIITNLNNDGSGGVGPTVADPITGQIINGTVNVYAATTIDGVSNDLNKVINIERGLITDTVFSEQISKNPLMSGFRKEVNHFCPELIRYARGTQKQHFNDSIQDSKYINSCLEKIVPKRLEMITVHEMGHTLGLRHNFYASYDEVNTIHSMDELKALYPESQFKDLYKYIPDESFLSKISSAMDYVMVKYSGDNGLTLPPPSYADIYNIAYLYAEKIPVSRAKGSALAFKKLDVSQDIVKQKQDMQIFKYCTDHQAIGPYVKGPNIIDPACALHDYGQSYSEIMDGYFSRYRDNLVVGAKKIGRQYITSSPMMRANNILRMSMVYANWRYNLRSFLKDPMDKNLLDYNAKEFVTVKQRLKDSKVFAKDYDVSDKYYNYMMEIANLSNYYCVTRNKKTKQIRLREFKTIQDRYFHLTDKLSLSSCEDEIVKTNLVKDFNEEILTEFGLPLDSIKFSQNLEDSNESIDVVGTKGDRLAVAELLSGIPATAIRNTYRTQMSPSVLHEPDKYEDFKEKVMRRLFSGAQVAAKVNQALKAAGINEVVHKDYDFKNFIDEESIYSQMLMSMLKANIGSDSLTHNRTKLRDFGIMSTQYGERVPGEANTVRIGNVFYFATPNSVFANQLINQYKMLENPLYVNVSKAIGAQGQQALDIVIQLTAGLPFAPVTDNYVSKPEDFKRLLMNFQQIMTQAEQNPGVQKLVIMALQPYGKAIDQFQLCTQIIQKGKQTGEDMVEIQLEENAAPQTFSVAEAQLKLEKLSKGFTDEVLKDFELGAPITGANLMMSYVNQISPEFAQVWKKTVLGQQAFINDFDAKELSFYKNMIETQIIGFSQIAVTQ